MQGTIGLLRSKRGVFCLLLIALAFTLVLLDKLTGDAWADFAKWIAAFLVAGHTASSVMDKMTTRGAAQPTPGPQGP